MIHFGTACVCGPLVVTIFTGMIRSLAKIQNQTDCHDDSIIVMDCWQGACRSWLTDSSKMPLGSRL